MKRVLINLTAPARGALAAAGLVLLGAAAADGLSDAYGDARARLAAAYQAQDFEAMRQAAEEAASARPGYPGALFNRALAEVLDGDGEVSLQTLSELVAWGVDFGVADIPEFAALQSLPGWADYAAVVKALNEPSGSAEVAFTHHAGDFVPEGIAVGRDGELYIGSVRHGTIVSIDRSTVVLSDGSEHWSVFGMRLDGRGGLWFASAAVPEFAKDTADAGRTGLFHLNLDSGEIDVRARLPVSEQAMVLGDLVMVDEDTILATESLVGALYRYSISTGEFVELVGPGSLRSLQGLVLDESGGFLYVADYVGGLFRVRLLDNHVEPVTAIDPVSLFGIDGLYRYGNELIAIQNGIRPHRVVALMLSDDGLSITGSRTLARNLPEFDEPTLGALVGDEFYFVANSHWNRFDRDGNLPNGLAGPVVMKISLGP